MSPENKTTLLTYLGSNDLPVPSKRHVWPEYLTVNLFGREQTKTPWKQFLDHKDGEGIILIPISILRMRVERAKCPGQKRGWRQNHIATKLLTGGRSGFLLTPKLKKMLNKVVIKKTLLHLEQVQSKEGARTLSFYLSIEYRESYISSILGRIWITTHV